MEWLAQVGGSASVGSCGDSYVNALAGAIFGLYSVEFIRHLGPWRVETDMEIATLERAQWFNNQRLLEPIGDGPLAVVRQ